MRQRLAALLASWLLLLGTGIGAAPLELAGIAPLVVADSGVQMPGQFELLEGKKVIVPGLAPRNQFADTAHLVLGWATLAAGAMTGLATPENAGYDLHHVLGWTTAGLAAGALATGAWAHFDDVGFELGLSSPNIHALLGIAGGLLMIAAPLLAPAGGGEDDGGEFHALLGAGGELLMGIAIAVPLVTHPQADASAP